VRGSGFLAIWSDVEAARETDYLHWLMREHMQERLGVPGFLAARVWRAARPATQPGTARFMILYELEAPDVVASQAYLARLNAPTPWSQRVMPTLGNFVRGGGRRIASTGGGQGGAVAAWRFDDALPADGPALVARLAASDRIAAVHLLQTDDQRTSIRTQEKSLRSRDASFAGLLLVEALDAPAIRTALETTALRLPEPAIYAPVFGLQIAR